MAFRLITFCSLILFIHSCSSETKKTIDSEVIEENKSIESNTVKKEMVSDSGESFINLNSTTPNNLNQGVEISNTIYSLESFKFRDSLQHFVCKATIEESGTSAWMHGNRTEKYEFFDYDFNKKFEISSSRREIELEYEYFITRSLFTDFPRIFELNNYETNKAFVKCSGLCWIAEVPNADNSAYFGYQPNGPATNEKLEHLGTLYYGLNGQLISELRFFYHSKQRYHSIASISLEPKASVDRFSNSGNDTRELTLWSQEGKSGREAITDFEILVKLKREKEHKSNQYETIEYVITLKKGKLTGKGLKATAYGYELILL